MSRGARLSLAGVVAIAAILRFAALGHNSVWVDEAYVVWLTQLGTALKRSARPSTAV